MFAYSYFLGTLIMLVIWGVLYYRKPELRKTMLVFSTICGIAGFFSAFIYNQDWWLPLTITHTFVGIEDLLFGFTIAGIAATLPAHIHTYTINQNATHKQIVLRVFAVALITYALFLPLFFVGVHSFYAAIIAAIIICTNLLITRPHLLSYTLIAGLYTTIALLPAYLIPELFNPGWLTDTWMVHNLTGFTLFGIVIEDLLWVYIASATCAVLYRWSIETTTQKTRL